MNAITKYEGGALALPETELLQVLQSSLYPGASPASIKLVLGYCKAAGLDPMQKPVHIVPMWDSKAGKMRDVVMPGVNLYRIQASRSGQFAGMSEPEFGEDQTATLSNQAITFPQWCRVTVRRLMDNGTVAEFTAREYWLENYAVKGGKEKSIAPNAMWMKRPRGQIAKCAQAQALRIAFPEIASQPTADEMEGKALHPDDGIDLPAIASPDLVAAATAESSNGVAAYGTFWKSLSKEERQSLATLHPDYKRQAEAADKARTVDEEFVAALDATEGDQ